MYLILIPEPRFVQNVSQQVETGDKLCCDRPRRLGVVGRGGDISTAPSPVDVVVRSNLELVVGILGFDLERVGTEVVTLGLEKVGGQIFGAVSVEEGQSGAEGWHRDPGLDGKGNHVSPPGLSGVNSLVEEVVEKEVFKIWLLAVGRGDVLQEDGSDDATTTPHEGNGRLVELPAVLLGGSLHQHETLGVRDDLGGVQALLKVLEECSLVTSEGRLWPAKDLGSTGTLVLDGAQAAGEDSLTNEGHGHTEVKSVDGSPLAGTFLAGSVQDLFNQGFTIIIVEAEDVAGDFNQERVEDAIVPFGKDVTHFCVAHTETTVHDIVRLANQLHVTIFDTVVNHLDIVASTVTTNPVAARLAIGLGSNALEDVLDVRPGLFISTRHQRWTITGTFFTSRDTGADKADALLRQILGTAVAVWVMGVSTVNDDVALFDEGEHLLNEVVDRRTSHDQKHHTTRLLELGNELLNRMGSDNGFALGLILEEAIDLGDGSVESNNGEAVIRSVENQILAHDREANETEITNWTRHVGGGTVEEVELNR